jgi:hypothetical protein
MQIPDCRSRREYKKKSGILNNLKYKYFCSSNAQIYNIKEQKNVKIKVIVSNVIAPFLCNNNRVDTYRKAPKMQENITMSTILEKCQNQREEKERGVKECAPFCPLFSSGIGPNLII